MTVPLLPILHTVARRVLRSEDLASDAVQEALLSLWNERGLPPNPRAWLIRTVIHRSLHLARCESRRRKHEERACLTRLERQDNGDLTGWLDSENLLESLQAALTEIPPEYRAVFVMRVFEQKDYATIAALLEIPLGTVRSRLNRSRKLLREILDRFAREPE